VEPLASAEPTIPLGLDPDPSVHRFTLAPADQVLLYTDGLVEVRAPDGQQFELDGQAEVLLAASSLDAALDGLVARLLDHAGGLWGAEILIPHAATSRYSWMRPPSTSRRRTSRRLTCGELGSCGSGTAKARLRCGRCWL
jgi:hypothetical protein